MNLTREADLYAKTTEWNDKGFEQVYKKFHETLAALEEYAKEHNNMGSFNADYQQKKEGNTLKIEVFIPSGE